MLQNRDVSTKCQINYVDIKNDVHVVPHWNQTPSHAAQIPQNTQNSAHNSAFNSAFIGICPPLIQSLVESLPLRWGGCSLGMFEYCRWALECTSWACVCMSSFVPRRLCHVFFFYYPPGLNTKWHISCVFTLTSGSAAVRPIIFTIGWECHATDVSLGRKHLKAKGRIFSYPVWEVTSFWVSTCSVTSPQPSSPSLFGIEKHCCEHRLSLNVALTSMNLWWSQLLRAGVEMH